MPTLYYIDTEAPEGLKIRQWYASKADRDAEASAMLFHTDPTPPGLEVGELKIPTITKRVVVSLLTQFGAAKVPARRKTATRLSS